MAGNEETRDVIRVAIIDDHTLFREGMGLMLNLETDMALVGEASTVEEGLAMIVRTRPDLVLLDLRLAQGRGVDVLSRLAAAAAAPRVLVVTAFPEEGDIVEALRHGAKGVVLKDATRQVMVSAVRAVCAGQTWLPPELSVKVITALTQSASPGTADRVRLLTPRERDIVVLIGQGLKNREIAERLGSAEKTIKGHLTTIFYKLGVPDRLALALLAVKIHLAPPDAR